MTSRRSGMDVPVILDTEGQGDGAGMYVRAWVGFSWVSDS